MTDDTDEDEDDTTRKYGIRGGIDFVDKLRSEDDEDEEADTDE